MEMCLLNACIECVYNTLRKALRPKRYNKYLLITSSAGIFPHIPTFLKFHAFLTCASRHTNPRVAQDAEKVRIASRAKSVTAEFTQSAVLQALRHPDLLGKSL